MQLTRRGLFKVVAAAFVARFLPTPAAKPLGLNIDHIVKVSYASVLKERYGSNGMWADPEFLRKLEERGILKRVGSDSDLIEIPLDYVRNV